MIARLFFYVGTSVVGLLVWLDYEHGRRAGRHPGDEDGLTETTAPDIHKGGGAAH